MDDLENRDDQQKLRDKPLYVVIFVDRTAYIFMHASAKLIAGTRSQFKYYNL